MHRHHAHTMTPSELACAEARWAEYEKLHQHWMEWKKKVEAEPSELDRPPLAITGLVHGFMQELSERIQNCEDSLERWREMFKGAHDLAIFMFHFGQYLMLLDEPVLYEDLGLCNCTKLTDDDISKLLGSSA